MSLELAIKENTEAVKALTAALLASKAPEACCSEKPKKVKPEAPISTTDGLPKTEQVAPAATPAPTAEAKVTLADLQAEGKKLLDAGKVVELKRVVADLGGTKLSLLPAEQYPAALKALRALTANI